MRKNTLIQKKLLLPIVIFFVGCCSLQAQGTTPDKKNNYRQKQFFLNQCIFSHDVSPFS